VQCLPCSACRAVPAVQCLPRRTRVSARASTSVAGARQVARYGVSTLEYLGVPMSTREYTVFEHRNTPFCVPLLEYPYVPCPCTPVRPPSACAAAWHRRRAPSASYGYLYVYMPIYMCARIYMHAICSIITHTAREHRAVHTHARCGGGAPVVAAAAAHSSCAEASPAPTAWVLNHALLL
jgi:hypothetical protein